MPRAVDAFLPAGGLPRSHDPLVRVSHSPPKVSDLFDVDAFIQMWEDFLDQYLFDIIESVTGIDLSSIQGLVDSITDVFFSGFIGLIPGVLGGLTGAGGLGAILGDLFGLLGSPTGLGGGTPTIPGIGSIPLLGGLFGGDGKILTTLLTVPVSVITGLTGAVQTVQQELVDLIVNAIAGTPGHTGNAIEMVFTGLSGITTALGAIDEVTDSLSFYFQDMASLLVQIVQQATVRPVLGVIDQVMDAVSFWIFGWFHRTEKAHTSANAGIAALRGEMNAKIAQVATGTDGIVDPFDTDTTTTRYTTAGGYTTGIWVDDLDGSGHIHPPSSPSTMYSNTDPVTDNIDVEMAMYNVGLPGRWSLWIGNSAGTSGIGVRVDNQIGFAGKQRIQLFTPNSFSNKNMHGNLYSEDVGTWHEGDVIRLRKNATTGVHKAYLNDDEVCSWDDSLGPVTDGSGFRKVGWQQNIEGSNTNRGQDLDFFHAYDWTT